MTSDRVPVEQVEPCPVRDYVDEYYFAGDEGDFTPNSWQRAMIEDAIHGYIAEQAPDPEHVQKLIAYLEGNGDGEAAKLVREIALAARLTHAPADAPAPAVGGDVEGLGRWPGYDEQSWQQRFQTLNAEHHRTCKRRLDTSIQVATLTAELARMKKEAREVLEPFKKALEAWGDEPEQDDCRNLWEHPAALGISLGNLRRARSFLSSLEGSE